MSLFPTATAKHGLGVGLQHVAVAVTSGAAVQTAQVLDMLDRVTSSHAVSGLVPWPFTEVAAVHSSLAVRTVADLVTNLPSAYSSTGMADDVFAAVSGVSHFTTVHASHLSARVTATIRHVPEFTAVIALQHGTGRLEIPPICLEFL